MDLPSVTPISYVFENKEGPGSIVIRGPNNSTYFLQGKPPERWAPKKQLSGQIIATSHDLTPNGGLVREITLFQGNLGW